MMKRMVLMALVTSALACSNTSEPHLADTTNATPAGCLCDPRIAPTSAVLPIGSTVQLVAEAHSVSSTAFIWTSSDTTVASVAATNSSGQTALVSARRPGTVSIKATAFVDPTQSASAVIAVFDPSSPAAPTVAVSSINELPANIPANLAFANGSLAVTFSSTWDGRRVSSAALIVHRTAGDTTVATVAAPASLPSTGRWTETLTWNTAARSSTGAPLFPNGSYSLFVRALLDSATVESTHLGISVSNP